MKNLCNIEISSISGGSVDYALAGSFVLTAGVTYFIYKLSEGMKPYDHKPFYEFVDELNKHCNAQAAELKKYKAIYGELPLESGLE